MLLALILFPIAAFAVNPDEVLPDPALESRARAISMELRCMVCQNQSIDDSNADLARDLRLLVRKRLVDGDTDSEVVDYLVSRYGEFVLLKPRFSERTWILWGTPVGLFIVGGLALAVFARRRIGKPTGTPLTGDEQARLDRLLSGSEPPSISPLVGEMSAAPTEGGGAAHSAYAASPPSVTS